MRCYNPGGFGCDNIDCYSRIFENEFIIELNVFSSGRSLPCTSSDDVEPYQFGIFALIDATVLFLR
jgi:hypothetical protein